MSAIANLDLSGLPTGPDLLLRNAFRLAEMPVDSTDRKLNKRQQRIERARNLSMALPAGECPIFPVALSEDEDQLKEALHRISDPVSRLFDELFWFWPRNFGDGYNDNGLQLLSQNKVDEAIRYWKEGEHETENFVSTHNLALLHQFLALELDRGLIESETSVSAAKEGLFRLGSGNKTEKSSRKHWHEGFARWVMLCEQESFWQFLRERIHAIDNPRLPLESADWLRGHLPDILLSVNVGLVLRAAEQGLKDHITRQRGILDASGFEPRHIGTAYDSGARDYRQRITRICKTVQEEAERDPVKASPVIHNFIAQASTLLQFLDDLYANENRAINALYDDVAEAIRLSQITFPNKTEDWEDALTLMRLAEPLARGEKVQEALADDIERLERNRDAEDNWCDKGYFDLPDPCLAILEEARAHEEDSRFDEAINVLRGSLQGYVDTHHHPDFHRHLIHCLAYCLKRKSIVTYNRGLDEYNHGVNQILNDSVRYNGFITDTSAACSSCGTAIYGSYVVRTIAGKREPFCNPCSRRVDVQFEVVEDKLDRIKQETLDQMALANHLSSGNKSITQNLKVISDIAAESSILAKDPETLMLEWDLMTADALIAMLKTQTSAPEHLFARLSRIITQQIDSCREQTLNQLFELATSTTDLMRDLLPTFSADSFIFSRFIKYVLLAAESTKTTERAAMDVIVALSDHHIKFSIIDLLERHLESPECYVGEILDPLDRDVHTLVTARGLSSFTEGDLGDLLSRASARSDGLEKRLIRRAIEAITELDVIGSIGGLVRAVHGAPQTLSVFYRSIFAEGEDFDETARNHLIEAIQHTKDVEAQFSVLEQLKEMGAVSPTLVEDIETGVCMTVAQLAREALSQHPRNWTEGEVGTALSYAAFYREDFEERLFTTIVGSVDTKDEFAANLLKGLSLIESDRGRFLEMMTGARPGLNESSRAIYGQLMGAHWDGEMRLLALQRFAQETTDIVWLRLLRNSSRNFKTRSLTKSDRVCGTQPADMRVRGSFGRPFFRKFSESEFRNSLGW